MTDNRNLANTLSPQTWEELEGHPQIANQLKKYIQNNDLPYLMYVCGPSGVGKTSTVNLFIKSLFCQNRTDETINPCGVCASCLVDPRDREKTDNVIWICKSKNGESLTKQFNAAITESYKPPHTINDPTKYWKIVVVDELQSVDIANLYNMLHFTELSSVMSKNRVVWILLTMNEEKIRLKDPQLIKSLKSRGVPFYFKSFTHLETLAFLKKRFPHLPSPTANFIAKYAEGSLREAIRGYELVAAASDTFNPDVAAQILRYIPPEVRDKFWHLLSTAISGDSFKELKSLWESISTSYDQSAVLQDLLDDIDNSILNGYSTPDQLEAYNLIYRHIVSGSAVAPWHLWRSLIGKKLVDPNLYTHSNNAPNLLDD